jgi:3-dehydroquinate synthase
LLNNSLTTITSAKGLYEVFMNDAVPHIAAAAQKGNAVVLVDANVARLHKERLAPALAQLPVFAIEATENNKTWAGVEGVIRFFMANGCNRNTTAIVIGGGIIQDISAFACHTFFRGIAWEFYPTTVLAMGDSCIGAKSGLNFENTKNLLGVFENPQKIVIDTQFATTLSEGDLCSGLGEILKLAFIAGEPALKVFADNWVGAPQQANLAPLIQSALATKKKFIEEDEFDHGIRRMLNYGHTFGHALESVTNYAIPHGTAVVVGMDIVNYVAVEYGMMSKETFAFMHQVIKERFAVRTPITQSQIESTISAAAKDKKRTANGINLAIVKKPGDCKVEPFAMDAKLIDTVKSYFNSEHSIIATSN